MALIILALSNIFAHNPVIRNQYTQIPQGEFSMERRIFSLRMTFQLQPIKNNSANIDFADK